MASAGVFILGGGVIPEPEWDRDAEPERDATADPLWDSAIDGAGRARGLLSAGWTPSARGDGP